MSSGKSPAWFFHAGVLISGKGILLEADEAVHAVKVKRTRTGDHIVIFDGKGEYAEGVVKRVNAKPVSLEISLGKVLRQTGPQTKLHLVFALPKGDRQSTLIDMACQLGVSTLTPLDAHYSSVPFRLSMMDRWHRIVMSACKQSRRAKLPLINSPVTLPALFDKMEFQRKGGEIVILTGAQKGASILDIERGIMNSLSEVIVVVGPEGGFDDEETELMHQSGVLPISASPHVLRTESATTSLLALAQQFIMMTGK